MPQLITQVVMIKSKSVNDELATNLPDASRQQSVDVKSTQNDEKKSCDEQFTNIPDTLKQTVEMQSIQNDEKNSSDLSSFQKSNSSFSKRNWDNQKDQIYIEYSDSMSFINIFITILVWVFLYFAISESIGKVSGWFLFVACYIFYLIECTNCPIFKSMIKRKWNFEHIQMYINSFMNLTPMITYAINKLVAVPQNNNSEKTQQQNDIESQNPSNNQQSQNNQNSPCQLNTTIQFQQETINFEFDKINYELINFDEITNHYDAFKLKINSVSKISDEYSQSIWSKKKEQFKQEQEQIKGAKIISSIQYTDFNNQKYILFMKSSTKFYINMISYSVLSVLGLSIIFRIFYNISIPTISAQLEKKLSC